MTEKEDQNNNPVETLTDEEAKILAGAIKKIENEIFNRVLKRLSAMIVLLLSIFLVGGLINLSSCSSNVEKDTVQKLADDPELRDKIINKVQEDFKDSQDKLKRLNEQTAEIERANARATATFVGDLEQIHFMVDRMSTEWSSRFSNLDQNQATKGSKKK